MQGAIVLTNVASPDNTTYLCKNNSNQIATCNNGAANAFIQGGNAFGAPAVLGTTDANNLQIITGNSGPNVRATFDQSNNLYLGNGVTAASPNNFTVRGTGNTTVGAAGATLTIVGGAGTTSSTGSAGGPLQLQGGAAGGSGNNAGGAVTVQGGSATGTAAGGLALLLGGVPASSSGTNGGVTIDTGNVASAAQGTIAIGNTNFAHSIQIGTGGSSTIQTVTIGSTFSTSSLTLAAGSSNITLNVATTQFSESVSARALTVQTRTTNAVGTDLTVSAGTAGSGASAFTGGLLTLQGGNAGGTGNANGGNVKLQGGSSVGTGVTGYVEIANPVFTATTQSFGSSTSVTQSIVDGFSTVVMTATATTLTLTLPDPTQTVTGKVFYVSAAAASNDFTLAANGGALSISMRANSTATMIWNGSDWTAAGADSSTSLQQVYNNTATSPVSIITTSAAKTFLLQAGAGFDSTTLFQVNNSNGASIFDIDTTNNNVAPNGGAESAFAGEWFADGISGASNTTVSRTTTAGEFLSGSAAVKTVITPTTANVGASNLTGALTSGHTYVVSFSAKSSTAWSDITVAFYKNSGTVDVTCSNYNTQTVSTTSWTRITCIFGPVASGGNSQAHFLIYQVASAARTFYIDNLSITDITASSTSRLIVGGPTGQGPTLFTLDQLANSPTTTGLSAYLGSMYYDTTIGQVRCYSTSSGAGGAWGSCGSGSLQAAYSASTGGTTPEVLVDTTRNGLDIQDANTTIGSTQALLAVRAPASASTFGNALFVVNASGKVGINLSATGANTATPTISYDLAFASANRTIGVETNGSNAAGFNLTMSAGAAGAGASAFTGGTLALQGGAAGGTGNAAGGTVTVTGGTGTGTSAGGTVTVQGGTGGATNGNGGDLYLLGGALVGSGTNGNTLLAVNSSNAAKGKVGIGTNNPGAILDVLGTVAGTITAQLQGPTSATQPVLVIKGGATPGSGGDLLSLQSSSATLGKVDSAGNYLAVGASTATTGTTTGTGTNTTTLTLTTDAFSANDVVFIDNAGQDFYTRITVDPGTGSYTVSPAVTFETSRTVTKYTVQNIGATASDYTTQANRYFQGYFLGGIVTGSGSTSYSDQNVTSSGLFNITSAGALSFVTSDASTASNVTMNPGITTASNGTGATATIKGGDANSTTCGTACTGGNLVLQGGSATGGSGTTRNGGNATVDAGTGVTADGSILLGTNAASTITLGRASVATTINVGQSTATNTINMANATTATGNTQTVNIATSATGTGKATVTIGNTNGASSVALQSGSGGVTITSNSSSATIIVKSLTNSATAFQVQNSGNTSLFSIDSSASVVYVGNPTADSSTTPLVLDNSSSTSDPTNLDGAMYYNTNGKTFRCFHNGSWEDCNFASLRSAWVLREDFTNQTITAGTGASLGNIGDNNWTLVLGSGASISKTDVSTDSSDRDRFGVLQINTGAASSSGVSLSLDQTSMAGVPTNMTLEFAFGPVNASAANGLQQQVRIGLLDGTFGGPTDGLYFRYSKTTAAGNWEACTTNNTTSTCNDSGVAFTTTANQYQRFKIVTSADGASVFFYINETLVSTNTTNLPASTRSHGPTINLHTVDTNARQYKIDYFQIKRNLTTLR
jgi:hypothetical protein